MPSSILQFEHEFVCGSVIFPFNFYQQIYVLICLKHCKIYCYNLPIFNQRISLYTLYFEHEFVYDSVTFAP